MSSIAAVRLRRALSCLCLAVAMLAQPAAFAQEAGARLGRATVFKLWHRGPEVETLRALLARAGVAVPPPETDATRYDKGLMAAVREFQRGRHMTDSGIPRGETIDALNGPAPLRRSRSIQAWLPPSQASGIRFAGRRFRVRPAPAPFRSVPQWH